MSSTPAALRIALLATYTADPLVPYLGVGAHEAGLPAAMTVGPLNQIARQCLDDRSETARARPDVLIVLPRFEDAPDDLADLADLAGVALDAVRRWGTSLVFVLPALPGWVTLGVGDHGTAAGRMAAAVAARETVRAQLSGIPNVHLADAESAVREVGVRRAHHPALFRHARIPYTEEVFAALGRQLSAVLRVRHGGVTRAVVLDADSLAPAGDRGASADVLGPAMRALRRCGVRIAVRGSGGMAGCWAAVGAAFGGSWPPMVDGWAVDDRPLSAQLDDLAEELGIYNDHMVLVTAGSAHADPGPCPVVALGENPDHWESLLAVSGVFDRAPVTFGGAPGVPSTASAPGRAAPSLQEYVANLGVELSWRQADAGSLGEVTDMLLRTKDFTLGVVREEHDLAGRLRSGTGEIHLAKVRDRLGDYGTGAAVGLDFRDGTCTVDVFLVSCPVLGKGVEQEVLDRIVRLARDRDCATVTFLNRETGRNAPALDFLAKTAEDLDGVRLHPS
ncbi:hypothetical protein [Streptosporangium sp. KLBMP 9127]|nr:hypothetical protein [Streptosporangium sp. KLBMP 9127]